MRLSRLPFAKLLVGLLLFAAVLRLGNMAFVARSPLFWAPTSDEVEHWSLALKLAAGDWLGEGVGPYFRPQLFAHAVGLLAAAFGPHYEMVHALNFVSDIAGLAFWVLFARRAFPRMAALAGGAFIACYWTFVHFGGTGYMESFAMALNAAAFWALAEHGRRSMARGRGEFAMLGASGVLFGLGALTRPQLLIVMPGIGAAIWWLHGGMRVLGFGSWVLGRAPDCSPSTQGAEPGNQGPRARAQDPRPRTRSSLRTLLYPSLFAVLVALAMSPNAIRHWAMFGLWAPMGTASEMAFHMGNNRDGWDWMRCSPGVEFGIYQKLPLIEGNAEPSIAGFRAFWGERNAAYLREEPGAFGGEYLRKLLMVFNAREVHCTNDFAYQRSISPVQRFLPGLGLLGAFGFAGLAWMFASRERGSLNRSQVFARLLIVLWAVPYLLGVALYLAVARHRLPALPPVMLAGGWMLWHWLRSVRVDRRRSGAMMYAIILWAVVLHLPSVPAGIAVHEAWWTRVNLGVARMALADARGAAAEFEEAVRQMPGKMEGWRQLSIARERLGELAGAVSAEEQVLGLIRREYAGHYPAEAESLERLAFLRLAAGDREAAILTAEKLLDLVPGDARAEAVLAKVRGTAP